MVRAVIQSVKHYVQFSLATVANGAVVNNSAAVSVNVTAANAVGEVSEGSLIKAVYVEFWVQQASTAIGSLVAGFYKNPGGQNLVSAADAIALGNWDNKKNLLYVTQGLAPENDAQLLPLYKGWIKIPKGKQRMGLGDQLVFFIRNLNAADDINFCGFFTYKEYK